MKHVFPISLVVAIVLITGVYFLQTRTHTSSSTTAVPAVVSTETQATTSTPIASGYSSAEVSTHTDATSCWTSIDGKVYDVTSWISEHPGGSAAILSLCGRDGSAAFNAQHGGQRRPESELAQFYIGVLK